VLYISCGLHTCGGSAIHWCTLRHTDSRLLFQTESKSVQCPKGHIVLVTEKNMTEKNKTRFGAIWQNPWGNFHEIFMRVCTVILHLYSRFHLNPFRFGGCNQKTLLWPPKWKQYKLLWAYNNVNISKNQVTNNNRIVSCTWCWKHGIFSQHWQDGAQTNFSDQDMTDILLPME